MPIWVRYRWVLLALAIVSWGVAFLALSGKGSDPEPFGSMALIAGIVFVWSNGFFWLIEIVYPHIESGNGQSYSRISGASGLMRGYAGVFITCYFLGAVAISVVCIRRLYAG